MGRHIHNFIIASGLTLALIASPALAQETATPAWAKQEYPASQGSPSSRALLDRLYWTVWNDPEHPDYVRNMESVISATSSAGDPLRAELLLQQHGEALFTEHVQDHLRVRIAADYANIGNIRRARALQIGLEQKKLNTYEVPRATIGYLARNPDTQVYAWQQAVEAKKDSLSLQFLAINAAIEAGYTDRVWDWLILASRNADTETNTRMQPFWWQKITSAYARLGDVGRVQTRLQEHYKDAYFKDGCRGCYVLIDLYKGGQEQIARTMLQDAATKGEQQAQAARPPDTEPVTYEFWRLDYWEFLGDMIKAHAFMGDEAAVNADLHRFAEITRSQHDVQDMQLRAISSYLDGGHIAMAETLVTQRPKDDAHLPTLQSQMARAYAKADDWPQAWKWFDRITDSHTSIDALGRMARIRNDQETAE